MAYSDLRDFEPEAAFTRGNLRVMIEKLGGGTVGREYEGRWRYIVWRDGVEVGRGQDFESGVPMSHYIAARRILEFFTPED